MSKKCWKARTGSRGTPVSWFMVVSVCALALALTPTAHAQNRVFDPLSPLRPPANFPAPHQPPLAAPDLVVVGFEQTLRGAIGTTYTVIVQNNGNAWASANTTVVLFGNSSTGFGAFYNVGCSALAPGAREARYVLVPPGVEAASDSIWIRADGFNSVVESDEHNNVLFLQCPGTCP
jgi:hypothetical protein